MSSDYPLIATETPEELLDSVAAFIEGSFVAGQMRLIQETWNTSESPFVLRFS
jgi:hypothetical protein